MCDNRNELHKSDYDKSQDNTSTRLDLDITETTDSYPEFDFLDLLRKLQVKEKKTKNKNTSEECTNKSSLFSEEDSDVEALARLYEEKYGTCNDYAKLGEGYDEEDSFIDNSDAVNDLVPNGIQTEFGGFYINRGKLNFVKEDNSSSSTSENVDKFLAHNRLNTRKIISDDENEEKESSKIQSNNQTSSNVANSHTSNVLNSNNNSLNGSNNQCSNNNNGSLHNNIVKSRKKSGEFTHKNKKIRKTATPKIPDHLLHKKPFPGSLEYRKNIKEFKKNRLKTVESDKKLSVTNLIVNNRNDSNVDVNINISHNSNVSSVSSNNNNNSEDDKETSVVKRKPLTVKELLKERDGVASGVEMVDKQSSSSSDSSDSSSSDSDSESSDDVSTEKEKVSLKREDSPPTNPTINGSISKEITAKSFAHLSDSLKDLIAKINEISKEEKNKLFNSKLNPLLVSLDDRLRELPMAERNAVLEYVAESLQMKKDNITKRTKKLLVLQEETKMSGPLRKLKEAVAGMMPLLESNYFNEYTKAAGTSPQIYAELSRYYWSIDPGSLPQRKFPWNDELRHYLKEIVQYRKNCYYIIRPRKESLIDYIRNFMEAKVKTFWPKEWMTVDILLEEAQITTPRQTDDKQKVISKMLGNQNTSSVLQKKVSPIVLTSNPTSRKSIPASVQTATTPSTSRKSSQSASKNSEVKSILIPRKASQGVNINTANSKSNYSVSSLSSSQNVLSGSRLQVTLNRLNVQEYLDRVSGSQTSISRNSNQQISPSRSQQSVSPNRLVKTSSPNSVLNPNSIRPNLAKNSSPNCVSKPVPSGVRNCSNSQSVLKTMEIHSKPPVAMKTSSNSVTISPVNETIFKDISQGPEVLNLTKNSSVYISKVKDCVESKTARSSSPSIGIPLPSGITISATNPTPSTFLAKPQKQPERNSDVKINVSIMKQDTALSLMKDKRESVLNLNAKREGPLQNIPDCISVTPKVVSNERHKYEHVRKRALHEYRQQQQQSPERLKPEEKKMKPDENLLSDMEIKEEKLDDKNFSKIFESVIAKTSETVRQSESVVSVQKPEKFGMSMDPAGGVRNPSMGLNQFNSNSLKMGDGRSRKDKPVFFGKSEGCGSEDRGLEAEDRSDMKEQLVQMEMDRVMQNLVELSREKNSEYEYEPQYSGFTSDSSALKSSRYQEAFQKVLFK